MLAQFANKEGVGDSDDYKRRLAAYQAKALRDSYLAQKIGPAVSEAEIKIVYDEESKSLTETERVRARHILVASEKEAKAILSARIARARSSKILPSNIRLMARRIMVAIWVISLPPKWCPQFSDAAFACKRAKPPNL